MFRLLGRSIQAEVKSQGSVTSKTYLTFFKYCGGNFSLDSINND